MSVVNKTIQVSQSADLVIGAVASLVAKIKVDADAGYGAAQIIDTSQEVFKDLVTVVQNVGNIPAEEKENLAAFLKAIVNGAVDIAAPFLPGPH